MMMATGGESGVMIDYNHENARAGSSDGEMGAFAHDFLEAPPEWSGDDVGKKLIFETGDLIL